MDLFTTDPQPLSSGDREEGDVGRTQSPRFEEAATEALPPRTVKRSALTVPMATATERFMRA
jgi:hypothetical protein